MDIILVVDNRERALKDELDKVFKLSPSFIDDLCQPQYKQMEIGDYAITAQGKDGSQVLAIIERKTLADYAASIIDKRVLNIEKMAKLKEHTNCDIFMLVEGDTSCTYEKQFGEIKLFQIMAHMYDLQIRHKIMTILTKDKFHTVRELKFLTERYAKNYDHIQSSLKIYGSFDEAVEKCKPTEKQLLRNELMIIWTNLLSKSEKIRTQLKPSAKAAVVASNFSLLRWLNGSITEAELVDIKINSRHLDGWQIEMLSKPMTREHQLKALSCIKNISAEFASALLDKMDVLTLMKNPKRAQGTVILGKRKLGRSKYEKIKTLFTAVIKD